LLSISAPNPDPERLRRVAGAAVRPFTEVDDVDDVDESDRTGATW
jgi:hypothetical protein